VPTRFDSAGFEEMLTEHKTRSATRYQVITEYQDTQAMKTTGAVECCETGIESYLALQLGLTAVQWLQLYLQGKSRRRSPAV